MDPGSEYSDNELIILLKQNNEFAFRLIFEEWHKKLYFFCMRYLQNKEQSEETVHDTLVKLWTSRHNIDENLPVGALLYTICKRLCLNRIRDAARAANAASEMWNNYVDLIDNSEERIILSELQDFTNKAVSKLPKQQQLVFKMSRDEGMSQLEIADKLNISKGTVKKHSSEAIKYLKVYFKNHFYLWLILSLLSKL
ncbi:MULTISPECIES: RNA polymerase sigma factor [Sphingobacterium]|uniref:RNA polymerase sigma factor n=1 Tax=Sphingobacterium TaxID=28453 RepID=UPI0010449E58|nr:MULTISPECIES: RNA polymerase sigma-70 factor [Sphingobacterium]MCW2263078.1 RNA polymerase sigma-70 factor (ECF subfamily) [Sphingobacterium kitahiroshimense]TCR11938.1 RNA polymerase sigma-70 factor (ECF subfamily) [Sphingobacterium sp. JUb78]